VLDRGAVPRLKVETPVGLVQQPLTTDFDTSLRMVADLCLAFAPEAIAGTTWWVEPPASPDG
jgi:hypothetical protein